MGADKLRCSDVNWCNEVDVVVVVVVVVEDAIGFVSFLLLLLLLVLVLVFLFLLLVLLLDDVNQPTAVDVTTLPKLRGAGGGFLEELIIRLEKCWNSCRMGWWLRTLC